MYKALSEVEISQLSGQLLFVLSGGTRGDFSPLIPSPPKFNAIVCHGMTETKVINIKEKVSIFEKLKI